MAFTEILMIEKEKNIRKWTNNNRKTVLKCTVQAICLLSHVKYATIKTTLRYVQNIENRM